MLCLFSSIDSLALRALTLITLCSVATPCFGKPQHEWEFHPENVWKVQDSDLTVQNRGAVNAAALLKDVESQDVLCRCDVRWQVDSPRNNFGFILRSSTDEHWALRFYDQVQALELLRFNGDSWSRVGERSDSISVEPDRWYRLEVAAVGHQVWARLWPTDESMPDWQLRTTLENAPVGRHGILVHDEANMRFRNFELHTEGDSLSSIAAAIQEARRQQWQDVRESLSLAVAPHEFPDVEGKRTINIVPFAGTDRFPLEGELVWSFQGKSQRKAIQLADYLMEGLTIKLPNLDTSEVVEVEFRLADGTRLASQCTIAPTTMKPWRDYVTTCLDTLCEHGRDTYGTTTTPLFMAVLDTSTLRSPQHPLPLDALVRLEGRMHRRAERGSNLWYDQSLLLALYRTTQLTGDPSYAQLADEYTRYFLRHCHKQQDGQHVYHTGLPAWGTHVYWNCFEERPDGDQNGSGPHEILVFRANWDKMFELAPNAATRIADGVWTHHIVDKGTGFHNRHDDQSAGCDFAFSGGSFVHLLASAYAATVEERYLDQAKTIADWHWKNRNPQTDLPADCPGLTDRYDGQHTFTTVVGPHAMQLLEAYQVSDESHFFELAATYIKQYDQFAWDEAAQSYWAMLTLDGQPIKDRKKGTGYGAYAPTGHVNVWRTTFYSYEFTLSAAQAAMLAYELSGRDGHEPDEELLAITRRWAGVIEQQLPPHTGRRWKTELESAMPLAETLGGAYAEDYGRAISFFVHLYRATQDARYLELAENLAEESVRKLFHHGLFKGHAAKPYYEVTNGVGLLLYALLELDAPEETLRGAY